MHEPLCCLEPDPFIWRVSQFEQGPMDNRGDLAVVWYIGQRLNGGQAAGWCRCAGTEIEQSGASGGAILGMLSIGGHGFALNVRILGSTSERK